MRWECVKSQHLVISKGCGKRGRPDSLIVRSSTLSIRPAFPPLPAPVCFQSRSERCWTYVASYSSHAVLLSEMTEIDSIFPQETRIRVVLSERSTLLRKTGIEDGRLAAAATQEGAHSRVITAIAYYGTQVVYLSYGWQSDTSTMYEAQVATASCRDFSHGCRQSCFARLHPCSDRRIWQHRFLSCCWYTRAGRLSGPAICDCDIRHSSRDGMATRLFSRCSC